jgi:hypothetical protein
LDQAGKLELYNLAADISEKQDLADAQPDKAKELRAELDKWLSGAVAPGQAAGAASKKALRKAKK